MKATEKNIKSYNEKADYYDDTFDGRYTKKFKEQLLDEVDLNTGDTVLDIACGNGTLLDMLAKKHSIIGKGVDISEKMVENARLKVPNMEFVVSGCESVPFEDKSIDVITVCAAYHHFPSVKLFAKEVSRLLRKNGKIYIAEIYYTTLLRFIINPFVPLLKSGDVRFYSPEEIIKNFEAFGFKSRNYKINDNVQIISLEKL